MIRKYARFSDLFTEKGEYKLTDEVAARPIRKRSRISTKKVYLNIDGRANLLFGALGGSIFKFFPLPDR